MTKLLISGTWIVVNSGIDPAGLNFLCLVISVTGFNMTTDDLAICEAEGTFVDGDTFLCCCCVNDDDDGCWCCADGNNHLVGWNVDVAVGMKLVTVLMVNLQVMSILHHSLSEQMVTFQ